MARMRIGASWNEVCILNISSRGLSMQAAVPPQRGAYLEVRRGVHQIAARVVWSKNHRFGVCTQDPLPIDAIIHQANAAAPDAVPATADGASVERRQRHRTPAERHERSRMLSRMIEFGLVGAFAASAAVATFGALTGALQQPLVKASAALARD